MLGIVVKRAGLAIVGERALPKVWNAGGDDGNCDAQLLLAEIFTRRSIVFHLMNLNQFELPPWEPRSQMDTISERDIAGTMQRIADGYKHHLVNEAHLMLALRDVCPAVVERRLEVLTGARRTALSQAGIVSLVSKLRGVLDEKGTERVLETLGKCAITMAAVSERLDQYLRSSYFPFGMRELDLYEARRGEALEGREENAFFLAFAAHRSREAELRMAK